MSLLDLTDAELDARITAIRGAIDKFLETGGLVEIRVDDRQQKVDIDTLRQMESQAVTERLRRTGQSPYGVKQPVILDR